MGVPLLNKYKQSFLLKRIPQTVLGGLKLRLGYEAPFYVYLNQITLWLVPLILGCIFTVVLELAYSDEEISDFLLLYTCLYGACIIIFVVVVQTISTVVEMKEKENQEHAAAGGLAITQKKRNLFSEEDQVEFESCCGADTLTFVVPPKKFKINIAFHALLSGAVCGLGFWYLLPYTLNKLYGHSYGATGTVFALGWLTVCVTQFSLTTTAPPEPAVYRTVDAREVLALTRPLYALLCYAVHVAHWYHPELKAADQALHAVFVCLPVLWLVGLPPPAEVLLLWLTEQAHVCLLGGSPAASTLRLMVTFALSVGVVVASYMMSSVFASVVLAALAGYLLSCDLGGLGAQVWSLCHHSTNRVSTKKPSALTQALSTPESRNQGFLWTWGPCTALYHAVVMAAAGAAAGFACHQAKSLGDAWRPLGFCLIGLCVAEKLLREAQTVYGGLGLWRNCLYPGNVDDQSAFRRGKQRLVVLGVARRCLINWVCPLALVFYIGLTIGAEVNDVMDMSLKGSKSRLSGICYVLGVVRVLRWSWQSTAQALLEVSAVHAVLVFRPPGHDALDFPAMLLAAALARDRLSQVCNKLFFWLAVLVSWWTDKKQRRGSPALVLALNLALFPAVLALILAASALSAPLLCVFTLPVFFIGFPRPAKFWSEPVGSSASTCPDTLYYRQLSSELARALRSAFANGSLGEPDAGSHYLARFQDRLVWVSVLERGAAFVTVSIKGLELQETSCHTAEAARLDDQFSEAFVTHAALNHYPLHCLTPLDVAMVRTYSDAKNVLTGVIDAPGVVETTLELFAKSLVWLLLRHVRQAKRRQEEARRRKEMEIARMESDSDDWDRKLSPPPDPGRAGGLRRDRVSVGSGDGKPGVSLNMRPFGSRSSRKGGGSSGVVVRPPPPRFGDHSGQVIGTLPPINLANRTSLVHSQPHRPGSGDSQHSSKSRSYSPAGASLQSYTDIFSDEEDGGGDHAVIGKKFRLTLAQRDQQQQHHELSTIVTITHNHPNPLPPSPTSAPTSAPTFAPTFAPTSLPPLFDKPSRQWAPSSLSDTDNGNHGDDLLSESDFGMPAVDINIAHTKGGLSPSPPLALWGGAAQSKTRTALFPAKAFSNGNHIFKPVMNLAGSPDFKCPFSSHISLPVKWRELPIEPSQLSRYMGQFPTAWYQHVLRTLDWSSLGESVVDQVSQDDTLTNCYSQLVMACYLAFVSPGYHSGPSYLYKCYNGDVPWNAMMDWLAEDKELHSLVIDAFRYSFKLMLDQTLMGDVADAEELEESLVALDANWYIGREADPDWGLAVVSARPNLFSLGYSQAQVSGATARHRSVGLQPGTGQWG
ncbi:hypothetical protein EGW08_000762 [Elysia chlorotica]|uniref:Pecanex-like protein n=1 Tax=Elysia chlorotica TaxID=188477 RepID=A0A3S1BXP3_ELYCH|nr:hypothetical protein EGW08_000762 [Elysia chlorotica]